MSLGKPTRGTPMWWATCWWVHLIAPFPLIYLFDLGVSLGAGRPLLSPPRESQAIGLLYWFGLIPICATIKHLRWRWYGETPWLDRIQHCVVAEMLSVVAAISCRMYVF